MNCENCGMPDGSYTSSGETVPLTVERGRKFGKKVGRRTTRNIWCCSASCAVQQRALTAMGNRTADWPISLCEFASREQAAKLRLQDDQTVTKTIAETPIDTGDAEAEFTNVGLPPSDGVLVTRRARKGGRPRKLNPLSAAQKMRRYRARQVA